MTKTSAQREAQSAVDACADLLREDPKRLKRLLREAAGLLDDVVEVLLDAGRPAESKQLHRIAKLLRGAAILPATFATAGLKKAMGRVIARRG